MYIDNKRFSTHMLRLKENDDVLSSIENFIATNAFKNVFILTAIGDLRAVMLRESADSTIQFLERNWRILGLFAFSREGKMRIRCLLINDEGQKIAGELLAGSLVGRTTDILFGEHKLQPRPVAKPHQS
ncbi:MAG: PPC domain-containing DNA-binding protein [Calditrichia bacterium]